MQVGFNVFAAVTLCSSMHYMQQVSELLIMPCMNSLILVWSFLLARLKQITNYCAGADENCQQACSNCITGHADSWTEILG